MLGLMMTTLTPPPSNTHSKQLKYAPQSSLLTQWDVCQFYYCYCGGAGSVSWWKINNQSPVSLWISDHSYCLFMTAAEVHQHLRFVWMERPLHIHHHHKHHTTQIIVSKVLCFPSKGSVHGSPEGNTAVIQPFQRTGSKQTQQCWKPLVHKNGQRRKMELHCVSAFVCLIVALILGNQIIDASNVH